MGWVCVFAIVHSLRVDWTNREGWCRKEEHGAWHKAIVWPQVFKTELKIVFDNSVWVNDILVKRATKQS